MVKELFTLGLEREVAMIEDHDWPLSFFLFLLLQCSQGCSLGRAHVLKSVFPEALPGAGRGPVGERKMDKGSNRLERGIQAKDNRGVWHAIINYPYAN